MALQRYNSQSNAPVSRPSYMNHVRVSNAPAMGLSQVGQSMGQLGGMMQDEKELKRLMQQKYQQHLDSLRSTEINDLANISKIKIDTIYRAEPDPEKWEPMIQKELAAFRKQAELKMGSVSSEQREFLEKELDGFSDTETARMESIRLKQVSELNKVSLAATLETAIATGNEELAVVTIAQMDEQSSDWFGTKTLYDKFKQDIIARGEDQFQKAQEEQAKAVKEQGKDAIASAVQGGVFTDTTGSIDTEGIRSMVESLTDDPSDRKEYMDYAKSVASTYKQQQEVNTDNLQNDVLTVLFNHRFDSPEERMRIGEEQAGRLENSGISPSRYSSLLSAIKGFQDEPPKGKYNPMLSANIQSQAEDAETVKEKNDVIQTATDAFNGGKISEVEYKQAVASANKSYKTVIGQKKKEMVDDFRYVMTKGYTTNALEGWLRAQLLSAKARGESADIAELSSKWTMAAQARQWIVNEYNHLLEQQVDRIEESKGRDLTGDEIRTVGLSIQRFWLRKSDSQLVGLYEQWLNR